MARKVEDPAERFQLMKDIAGKLREGEHVKWLNVDMYTYPRTVQECEQGSQDVAREVIAEVKARTGQLTNALAALPIKLNFCWIGCKLWWP